jgi:hypothetical protein
MPNWCENHLEVTGPAEGISELVKAVQNPDATSEDDPQAQWDLTLPIPMPAILHGTRSPSRTVEEAEEDIAKLIERRDAGDLQAHENYQKEVTSGGSWMTDEFFEGIREQARTSILAKAETGYSDWYDWSIQNWGTKWSPSVSTVTIKDTAINATFDSAWGPPDTLILGLSGLFPTLTFILQYSEPGMGYLGACAYVAGEEVGDSYMNDVFEDPVLAALYKKTDDDLDEDTEQDIHDKIHDRWCVLQERVGTDVRESVTN